jgi:hypothetical protein
MTMAVAAVDYEGSGAIHYLRTEIAERREIHLLLAEWPPYVEHSNSFTLPRTNTITSVFKSDFEARKNLHSLTATIRTGAQKLVAADLAAAENALQRLESRKHENVDTWADGLSEDLSLHRD